MSDRAVRMALWASAVFNLLAAIVFAFASKLGHLAGLPLPVPRLYAVFLALFIALFGGMYGWLARSPRIDRSMVAFGAIGKSGAVLLTLAFYFLGEVGIRALAGAGGDLLFAVLFAMWLRTPSERVPG